MATEGSNEGTGFGKSKIFRAIYISVIAGAGVYLIGVVAGGATETLAAASLLGPEGWLFILGLSLLNYGIRYGRWRWYLALLNHSIPLKEDLTYYIAGFALTTTPGKAGEAIRSLYLKDHGVDYEDSIAVLFVERLTDLVAMILLAFLVVSIAPDVQTYLAMAGGMALAGMIFLRSQMFAKLIGSLGARKDAGRFGAILRRGQHLFHASARLLSFQRFCAGTGVGVVAWAAEGYGFFVICQYLGIEITVVTALGIYASAILAGAISFIPGGLGTTEAAMGLLLILSGADTATAIAATIICRVATLWFAVLLGLVTVIFLEFTRKHRRIPQV